MQVGLRAPVLLSLSLVPHTVFAPHCPWPRPCPQLPIACRNPPHFLALSPSPTPHSLAFFALFPLLPSLPCQSQSVTISQALATPSLSPTCPLLPSPVLASAPAVMNWFETGCCADGVECPLVSSSVHGLKLVLVSGTLGNSQAAAICSIPASIRDIKGARRPEMYSLPFKAVGLVEP